RENVQAGAKIVVVEPRSAVDDDDGLALAHGLVEDARVLEAQNALPRPRRLGFHRRLQGTRGGRGHEPEGGDHEPGGRAHWRNRRYVAVGDPPGTQAPATPVHGRSAADRHLTTRASAPGSRARDDARATTRDDRSEGDRPASEGG